jgi:type II secretory pathway component PulJ
MKISNSRRKIGFTLIELLLVVGFISLAGIGIYTIYSKVQASNAALQESKNLETLRSGIRSLIGGQQNYFNGGNSIKISQ